METLVIVTALMFATVLVVAVGERLRLPWPVLLTVLAAGTLFIPGMPEVTIDNELILPLFLPPLLWALARRTSWGMFRAQWRTIIGLSVLLVFASVAAVTGTMMLIAPGMGFLAAMALGAAVAPPDPVSVEAVAEPAGIPRRIIGTLQTEGLFNDAASLVAFTVAVSALQMGDEIHWGAATLQFLYTAIVAVVLGLVVGRVSSVLLGWLGSPTAGNALTWVLPFATYVLAEELHASGVIAVVVAAVELSSRADATASDARLSGRAFWDVTELLITGLAFGLMGFSLRQALSHPEVDIMQAVAWGVAVSLVLGVVRALWMTVVWRINIHQGRLHVAPSRFADVVILTWSGMRGLVTLALVLSMSGALFPRHHEFTVVAFVVLTCTMIIPGLTLPGLVTLLGRHVDLEDSTDAATEDALDDAYDAAMDVLRGYVDEFPPEVVARVADRLATIRSTGSFDDGDADEPDPDESDDERRRRIREQTRLVAEVRREALEAAQRTLTAARFRPGVDPSAINDKLHELDVRIVALSPTGPSGPAVTGGERGRRA